MQESAAKHPGEPRVPPAADFPVVAIGGSAGGLKALKSLLPRLTRDFPAAVLVVLHLPARRPSVLPDILHDLGPMPVAFAREGDTLAPGRIALAPPDHHLILREGQLFLRRGPRENNARPAIDVLFRSVAVACGSRAIGLLVSGTLSDGVSGLTAIKRCGGTTMVQDPDEADYSGMPASALAASPVDHVGTLAELAEVLEGLIRAPRRESPPPPGDIVLEARIAAEQASGVENPEQLGKRSVLSCPECQGALWEIHDGDLRRFRCHIGHAFSQDTLEEAQLSQLDRALGSALRVIDERIHVLRGLAADAHRRQRLAMAEQWQARMVEYQQQAALIRQVLMAKINGDRSDSDA